MCRNEVSVQSVKFCNLNALCLPYSLKMAVYSNSRIHSISIPFRSFSESGARVRLFLY
jgi:hypothetical protein